MIVFFLSVVILHHTVKWPCGADGENKKYVLESDGEEY